MPRRERWSIAGAILAALEVEGERGSQARLTNVAARANLAYDRLQGYLDQMLEAGLVSPGRVPTLTPKGRDFLRHYRDWVRLLDRFGMSPRENSSAEPPVARHAAADVRPAFD